MSIRFTTPARVGLLGNPSDGYDGKTLSLAVPQLSATVQLEPGEGVCIEGSETDAWHFDSVGALADHTDRHGYGTGPQLLAATIRTFASVCETQGWGVPRNFQLSYETSIPRGVGLAGSSALVISALRCLSKSIGKGLPDPVLASVALAVETAELELTAGLQDRVVQSLGGLVAMDFGAMTTDPKFGVRIGRYEQIDPSGLPSLFVAWDESAAEPSTAYHRELRHRFDAGDARVHETLRSLSHLVTEGRAALRWSGGGSVSAFAPLLERSMGLRASLGPIPDAQMELIHLTREAGVSATFAGSGGAVVGAWETAGQLDSVREAFAGRGGQVLEVSQPEED